MSEACANPQCDICHPELLAEKYTKGIAAISEYLDHKYPGWAEKIDFSRLDMGNYQRCIGGQLAGHMGMSEEDAWSRLQGETFDALVADGKVFPSGAFTSDKSVPYWRAEVEKRVAQPVA